MFKPEYWAAISDIMDAFPIMPTHPSCWKCFLFRWYGQTPATRHETHLYVHLFADFGCAGVPATFDVLMRVVIGMSRAKGVLTLPLSIHVDDIAIAGEDEDQVNAEQITFADYLELDLGIFIKRLKLLTASQVQRYIGFDWDSISRSLSLPEDKLHEYLEALLMFISSRSATRKQAESLAGKLLRAMHTLPPGANCLLANLWGWEA